MTRILMLEDSPADAELAERALRRGGLECVSRRVDTRQGFVAALREFRPDVILADYSLPSFTGLDALDLTFAVAPTTPVLIVTGSLSEETAADCIKAGAVDYVMKERLGRLAPAVRAALEHRRFTEEKARAEEALRDSEQRYRALFTESRDGIFVADAASQLLLDANASLLAMSGYRLEQLRHTPLLSMVAPDYADAALAAWESTARGGTLGMLELEFARADGTHLPVEVRASAFTDADGAIRIFGMVRDASERRQRERELRASEQRHRTLFEQAHDAIFIADAVTGMLLDGNRAARAMTGCDVEALRRMHQSELRPPEERDYARAMFAQAAQQPQRRGIRHHVQHVDGRRTPVEIAGTLMSDEAGRPLLVGVFRDLTERRTAEAAAQESAERFRLVVEGGSEALFTSADRRFTYVNPAGVRLFGAASAEDLVGRSTFEHVSPAFHAIMGERLERLLACGRPTPLAELVFLRRDGTAFDVEVSSVPFPHEGRQGVLTFFRDITERKRATAELALLSTAISQAGEVAMITDTAGSIQYVNPAFERVTGYSRAEAVGQNPRILKSGVQGPEIYRTMWDQLSRGEAFSGTFVNRKKSGDTYVAEVIISPVRDASGTVVGYVGLQRDVTREHDLEDQLRQAQKMEAIGQLTGGIAHDFNNLLGVILSNAALLKGELPPDRLESHAYLADLEEAVNHGSAMVKKLLGFSRRETLLPAPTEIGHALSEFARTARRLVPETIAIRVSVPEDLVALADASALEQILLNLATNARDAMPEGGALTVTARAVEFHTEDDPLFHGFDRPGPYVCIAVTDSGHGMDQATLARVFEPFYTTKPPGAGTGLGLPMVYGLMKQQGGFVRLYSEPGQGTTVRLYLPATSARRPSARRADAPATVPGTETILVVEDQEMLRRATARALRKLGYDVLVASDGEEGLAMLAEKDAEVAMVLTDVVMPTLGGIAMVLRAREAGSSVRFLLMSGYATGAGGGSPPSGVPLLEKPWTIEALSRSVRAVLDGPPQT